jgi:hypothetical protein
MTEVSDAMFSCEPWALSMRMTASEVLFVVQPARPRAATSASTGRAVIFVDERKDRAFNIVSAMRARFPHYGRPVLRRAG